MRKTFLVFVASFALSAALILSGCKSSTPPPAQAPAGTPAQSSNPEGSAAPAPANSAGAPNSAPAVVPGTPATAPSASAPPPPPEPVKLTVPAGTPAVVTVTEQLSASRNNVGDTFSGVLAQPVKTASGATVFPRGARVLGTVVAAKGQGKFKGSGALGIKVTSIAGTSVSVTTYEKEQKGKGKRSAGFIGGGAGGGALIGGLAGGGKGALLGGLLGAGAGTAGAAFTGNKDVVIPSESTVTFRLTAPVTVTGRPKSQD